MSPYHAEKVGNYVLHQPEHHAAGNTHPALELPPPEQTGSHAPRSAEAEART